MSERVFAGQRTTTYTQAKEEVLKVFFHKHALYPVVIAGRVAAHLKCGLLEAENLLERMVDDGSIQYAPPELLKFAGLSFGYSAAVEVEAIAS